MTTPTHPAAWPLPEEFCCPEWDDFSEAVQLRSLALASSTLERLTAYRVSLQQVKLRPCHRAGVCGVFPAFPGTWPGQWMSPVNWAGTWLNVPPGRLGGCTPACTVRLGAQGVVTEVKVAGAVVPSGKYRQVGQELIWRSPEPCPWPMWQDLSLPDTEPGTFSITVARGAAPDGLAMYAVGQLACEYAKACSGKGKCRLPAGVTSVTRQGVTFEVPSGLFPKGLTGIREVDTFITLWNPNGLKAQPTIWSPDL